MSIFDALKLASEQIEQREKNVAYRLDIRAWAKDRLKMHLYSKQVEIAEAMVKYKKVAVKSCHGSGKSYFASALVAWWVETRYGTESVVVSTAPTGEQVSKILWRYIRSHHAKNNLLGRCTLDNEWKSPTGEELAWGRKPADTNLSGFQGVHSAAGVLAVMDEAGGLAKSIWDGVETITTGRLDRVLAIGNPDDANTEFGRIFREDDPAWHKITIAAKDTPNFTNEEIPEFAKAMLNGLISPEWVEEKKISWGEDSAIYQSKVNGEFPSQGTNSLFNQLTIAKGIETNLEVPVGTRPRLGVDVARFGNDYTVVYSFQSGVLRLVDKWAKTDLVDTAERVDGIARQLNASEVRIDGVGIGAGVYDMVTHKSKKDHGDYKVVGMIGNAQSPDLHKWVNARAWWYDTMREKMFREKIDIDPEDKELRTELETVQYKFGGSYNAIQIESKDDMKKRGVKSPDYADAAMYACADLPVDTDNPLAAVGVNETFEMELSDFLLDQEMAIGPSVDFDW